ncbi:hypothetical protein LTR56_021151 [Elasticomyces elasticus]|nr:hypothetical protein LTR56_021151 [Elasticomyces elasticus]KAK3631826.1 hypothetical protein LTR22_020894 [Elasticomyces elasticus]KAK4909682.1 hypothetical protein LTR49_021576 [Elasticomyces elasticus]KAK5749544.1 hypothetical protein LTS12_020410 [Elasticomyces elasticus]
MSQSRDLIGTASSAFVLNTKKFYNTGSCSDLTIECDGHLLRVHKMLLISQSSWFEAALEGKFQEALADNKILVLKDDDPVILKALIKFMYHFTYDDSTRGDESLASFAIRLYVIADKYDVVGLRTLAASKLDQVLTPFDDEEGFVSALEAIHEYTANNKLWDIAVPKILANIGSFVKNKAFMDLVRELPEVLARLLARDGKAMGEGDEAASQDGDEAWMPIRGGRRLG